MNLIKTGQYIAKKRRKKNLTQEMLAETLGVSNKTISKWENGKCMPDYSIIQKLCEELDVSIVELLDGKDKNSEMSIDVDNQIMNLMKRTQELENQKKVIYGMLIMVMGIALLAISKTIDGSNFKDLISGILIGLSIGEMVVGILYIGISLVKK